MYLRLTTCVALLTSFHTYALAADWPQWRGANRDGVWTETGVVKRFATPTLTPKWRVPVGPGYSGPTVADGRVFVTDRQTSPVETERIHCFDETTGKQLWTRAYPCTYKINYTAGPRACVTIDGSRAYALGAMGHLHCLNVSDGEVVWKSDLNQQYDIVASRRMPIWGLAAAPLVHNDTVILQISGNDRACMVALDKRTGDEVWRALNDRASYSAPVLISQAGKPVLVCWTGDSLAGLDPDTGRIYWREPFGPRNMPIGIATPIVDRNRVFVTSFYDGSLMMQVGSRDLSARKLWHRVGKSERETDALQSIISTPLFQGDYIYGVDSYGELRCLNAATGDRVWEDQTATPRNRWSNIHFVRNGDRIWMFNERGELIISRLSPAGFEEISRAKLISPTVEQLRRRDGVCWAHPAFANRHVFIRNDKELICTSLAAE